MSVPRPYRQRFQPELWNANRRSFTLIRTPCKQKTTAALWLADCGFPTEGNPVDLDPLFQGGCNPLQHRQGVSFVIGILEP
jgi:hypothetical protein